MMILHRPLKWLRQDICQGLDAFNTLLIHTTLLYFYNESFRKECNNGNVTYHHKTRIQMSHPLTWWVTFICYTPIYFFSYQWICVLNMHSFGDNKSVMFRATPLQVCQEVYFYFYRPVVTNNTKHGGMHFCVSGHLCGNPPLPQKGPFVSAFREIVHINGWYWMPRAPNSL